MRAPFTLMLIMTAEVSLGFIFWVNIQAGNSDIGDVK
jgi:hypothetical protein